MTDELNENPPAAPQSGAQTPEANDALNPQNPALDSFGEQLGVPGALEVDESDASREFLERQRQQTGATVQNVAGGAQEEPVGSFQGDSGGLKELLAEANLTGRHLKFCCSGVIFLGMVVAGAYFGYQALSNASIGDESVTSPPVEEEEVVELPVELPEIEVTPEEVNEYRFTDPSVMAGFMVGEAVVQPDKGTEAGENLGEALVSEDALAVMIRDFSEMYESMQVDVNELLDQSANRQLAYDDYRNELNYLLYLGRQNTKQLEQDSESLVRVFTRTEDEKDNWEARFFEQMRELDAYATVSALDEFIIRGEDVVRLRAEYFARQKLLDYYALIMESMERRIRDLEFNEEALVKGVRVVEVEGSDIELIIQESEL